MLGNMRFDISKNMTPNEKAHLNMLMMSMGRPDMLGKVVSGSHTRYPRCVYYIRHAGRRSV
jgi:hypothetical protein